MTMKQARRVYAKIHPDARAHYSFRRWARANISPEQPNSWKLVRIIGGVR